MRFNISLNKIAPANIPEAFLVKKSRCDYKHEVDKDKKKGIQKLMTYLKKGFLSKITDRSNNFQALDCYGLIVKFKKLPSYLKLLKSYLTHRHLHL